jgi:uncharacterized protein YyaL (SSP411 family)
MGYFAAAYAKQVDLHLHPPVVVNIVGEPSATERLLAAARVLHVPFRIVQTLDPTRDRVRVEALSLPAQPSPAAYVCVGTACSAPVTEPEGLVQAVISMNREQQVAPAD